MSKNQQADIGAPNASNVYGGPQPKDQERAREYLRMLKDTERFDELWQIWRHLKQTQPEDRSVVKRAQPWPTPCEKHAEDVYHAAKNITNRGFTFDLSDLAPPETEVAPPFDPRIFSQKEHVDGIAMSPQQQMFAHSDRERHQVHMAVQYAYKKDDETRTAYKYASFPTLDAMVAYAETIPSDEPQCFFELARENCIVAPYMDVDCTLDTPAPHLLDQIVVELEQFTREHLGKTPRVVCTDSSRDKGGGRYKNSWHIILHGIGGFRNGATDKSKGGDMRLFFEAFVASMGEDLKKLPEDTWDMSVYNKNSNMRCIGSHKADDPLRTRLVAHPKYPGAQMSDYYVQQPALKTICLPLTIAGRAPVVAAPARKKQKTTHTTPANVPKELGAYLQQQGMTIVSCKEMAPETDLFSAVPPKPATLIGVKCVCRFANRAHKSNHCYVIASEKGLLFKCHDEECKDKSQRLDFVQPSDELQPSDEPMQIEDMDATPTVEPQSTDTGGEPEPQSMAGAEAENNEAIAALLVWKLSHPFYRLQNLAVGGDAPLKLTFEGRRNCRVGRRTVEIAEFSTTWQVCPNARVGLEGIDILNPDRRVRCDGRLKLTLIKDMPHVIRLGCPCCTGKEVKLVATDADEEIEQLRETFKEHPVAILNRSPTFNSGTDGLLVAPKGFHRDDTHVHGLLWWDYDRVRGGLNHIAIFEDDANPTKIPHGTRCRIYVANELNDYAMRKQYHKRGAVVQVQSKHCPIAYETVLVGNEEMSFELFIQEAERALPRVKETLKTQDYEKWETWCHVADHDEFPRLKPDKHLLAFANVAVDITGGKMVVREFSECSGRVARAFNNIQFEPDYATQPFDELLGKCPLFRMYIETHFPADLVERFNFKHRQGSEHWWIGKIFCAMQGRLLFEVNELDRWRTMLYMLGPKNTGKSDLWRGIIQKFFDNANIYTYEKEPDKFSVAAMFGKEIAVAPDLKTQVQDAGTLQSMVCGEAVPLRNMRKIAESVVDWKVPQLFISNLLPPWKKDESGALMSRFLIFQFRELQGETDTSLPQRIVQNELAVVFALIMRAYADLRAYVGTAPAEEWYLPYFETVRASEEKRKQHLFRFLTEPRGNIRTKNAEIWIEPAEGEYTLLADLKKKFDLYMKFQYPGVSYSWDEQFPDACLRKAAAHHEYDPGWKITNRETFTQCVKCGKDATKTYDQKMESGTSCCKWFYENKREDESWRERESRGIVKKGKTKASESPDKVKGLVIREEPFSEDGNGASADLSNFVWNGNCGCGRPAIYAKTKDGRPYRHCAFGRMDDANCSFRFKFEDELQQFLPIDTTNGRSWPAHPDYAPVRDMVSMLSG